MIAELAERREIAEEELTRRVRLARQAHRSWSEIGAMLAVSKQQRSGSTGRMAPGPIQHRFSPRLMTFHVACPTAAPQACLMEVFPLVRAL